MFVSHRGAGKSTEILRLTERLREASFDGPSGPLTTDPSNQHMTQNAYIATIQPDKSFKLEETIENVVPQAGCTL